jgi:zinc/manganese transport system permease protein
MTTALNPVLSTGLSPNPIDDIRLVLSYHFMLNAMRAGTLVAVVAGAVGYVMVLRRQSFAGHTLALIGFPGAAGATWLGLGAASGYFGFCLAGALVIAVLPGARRAGMQAGGLGGYAEESAGIGIIQALALACGFLFVSLYHGFLSGLNNLLFGAITGITDTQVDVLAAAGVACLITLAILARPLLFATIDPAAAGVPVRLLGIAFLLLLGVTAAGTSQVTGSLLVFALLVAPAAAATRISARPAAGLALSVAIALLVTWLGEIIAFFSPFPIGFWVSTLGFAAFLAATAYRGLADRAGRTPPAAVNSRYAGRPA